MAESCGQSWEQGWAEGLRAWACAYLGQHSEVKIAAKRANAVAQRLGEPWLAACSDIGLALDALLNHDPATAARLLAPLSSPEGIALGRQLHAFASIQRALALYLLDDLAAARIELDRTVRLAAETQDPRARAGSFELMAYLLAAPGKDPQLSARLLGSARTGRDIAGAPLLPQWHAAHDQVASDLRGWLGEAGFEQAYAQGRRCAPAEALAAAARAFGSVR